MKILLLVAIFFSTQSFAGFDETAKEVSESLKKTLLEKLQNQIKTQGVVAAIGFCHEKALPLTKENNREGLEVGRTSDRWRNEKNKPEEWMQSYLAAAKNTNANGPYQAQVVLLKSGKKAFLSPLYIGPACLQCHGQLVGPVKDKIQELYPNDLAHGYRLGEFRGFVWVQEQ